jgi:hypothetical protein
MSGLLHYLWLCPRVTPEVSFLQDFHKCIRICHCFHACYMSHPSHPSAFKFINNILRREMFVKFLILALLFLPFPYVQMFSVEPMKSMLCLDDESVSCTPVNKTAGAIRYCDVLLYCGILLARHLLQTSLTHSLTFNIFRNIS